MSKKKQLEILIALVEKVDFLKTQTRYCNDYLDWITSVIKIVRHIFGENSSNYKDLHKIIYPTYMPMLSGTSNNTNHIDRQKEYIHHLDRIKRELSGMIQILQVEDEEIPQKDYVDRILFNTFFNFHKCVRGLSDRYNKRASFVIDDEHDVQDLLFAILRLHFNDVRKEDPAPINAGASSRVDIVLKNEKVLIEVKRTSPYLRDKEIGEQLAIDKQRYREHPDYKKLYCFIYDDGGYLKNPDGLERDLNEEGSFNVVAIVSPK